jgi:hypothetical protein
LFDFAGNQFTTANNTVTIDTTNPGINFTSPTENSGTSIGRTYVLINVTAPETNLANITIRVYNSTLNLINQTTTQTQTNYVNISGLADGIYYFNASAVDKAGNTNSTETRNVTINTNIPLVNIVYPQNTNYNVNVSQLNYTVSGINLQACWYSINGGQTNTTVSCGSNVSGLTSTEGNNTWKVYANNTAGIQGSSSVTFLKDMVYPLIDYGYNALSSGVNVSQNFVYVNVTVNETNEANITFRLYNATSAVNLTTYTTAVRVINWTSLPDAVYTYNVTVVDLASNSNTTATRTITLDRTAPNATLIVPVNNSYLNYTVVNFTANLTDNLSGIKNATLNIYNSTGLVNQTTTTFSGTVSTVIGAVVTLVDNVYTWFYSLFDFAGNQFTTANNTVTIDTANPLVYALDRKSVV